MNLRPLLKKVVPSGVLSALRTLLPKQFRDAPLAQATAKDWRTARAEHPWDRASSELPGGVNLIGYLQAAKGIGEAARNNALALAAAKVPFSVIDFEVGIPASQHVEPLLVSPHGSGFKFNCNLIHINPPQFPYLWQAFNRGDLSGRYNIGVWYWELPDFPDEWRFAFDLVDEVWVASQFVLDSVSAKASVTVVEVPPCVQPEVDQRLERSDYGLPDNRFLFLCAYDVLSIQERKNPLGAIEAFKRAFPPEDSSVGLVIKINNGREDPGAVKALRRSLKSYANCYVIDDVLDRLHMHSLIALTDAYVSLHRSEGFGLIPAEAMYLGKPVVLTNWSGNTDFANRENSCPVDYQLVPVKRGLLHYRPGQLWADADVEQAAGYLRRLKADAKYRAGISRKAAQTIRTDHSPRTVGRAMRARLQGLGIL